MADTQTGKTGLEAGQGWQQTGRQGKADIVKQVVEGWPGRGAAKAGGQDNADWQACREKESGINREKGIGR